MTSPNDPPRIRRPGELPEPVTARQQQARQLWTELENDVEPGPPDWQSAGIQYFVRRGYVLVRDEHADSARSLLPPVAARETPDPLDGRVVHGLRYVAVPDTHEAMGLLGRAGRESTLPEGVYRPEYLLHITDSTCGCCPADEPGPALPPQALDPPVAADPQAGLGIKVVVLDTGVHDATVAAHPWMTGVTGDPDPGVPGDGRLVKYAGHGTFIAGLVKAMAPAAEVVVRAAFARLFREDEGAGLGGSFELDLVEALERVLVEDQPDVISLSAGTGAANAEGPVLLNDFAERILSRYKGVVVVAAAGNDGRRQRFWPAASPWTVSVGSLAANGRSRAHFSNFGSWVDVYAPGEQLTGAFPNGTLDYTEPPKVGNSATFEHRLAKWSGTSFSTPIVAGLVAARMSRTGENGPAAAAALIAEAQTHARRGVGAVLLPDVTEG